MISEFSEGHARYFLIVSAKKRNFLFFFRRFRYAASPANYKHTFDGREPGRELIPRDFTPLHPWLAASVSLNAESLGWSETESREVVALYPEIPSGGCRTPSPASSVRCVYFLMVLFFKRCEIVSFVSSQTNHSMSLWIIWGWSCFHGLLTGDWRATPLHPWLATTVLGGR